MRNLRIAVTADPYIPVPPVLYGGIERVVDFVVRGLVERGHRVTLFAHPESKTIAELIPYGVPPHFSWRARVIEVSDVGSQLWRRHSDLDVVLSWGRMAALLPVLPLRRLAKIQRYCRDAVPWRSVKRAVQIGRNSIGFAGASESVYVDRPDRGRYGGNWRVIYDGVEVEKYNFAPNVPKDAPLVFLGRVEQVKGPHHAIAIAKATRRRLIIAGNVPATAESYFEKEIAPHLDKDGIQYIGSVDDQRKNSLLGSVAGLLMPTLCKEAFGLVMAEAFACGTPVIAFPNGSVPEVVRDGINGFICKSVDDAVSAVGRLDEIDRSIVRADCEARFNSRVITDAYEKLCWELTQRCAGS